MLTLIGTWRSHYEYGQGPSNKPSFNEHIIQFSQAGDGWVGVSLPSKEGSKVKLNVRQSQDPHGQFIGEWQVHTSPSGYYAGYTFNGLVLLLLSEDGRELKGEWIGATRTSGTVKHGSWILRRDV